MPKIDPIPQVLSVSTIRPGRHRPLDGAAVDRLAESIRAVGVLNPIAVRRLDADPGEATFTVVAGDHRLAAAVKAGLRSVPVHVLDLSDPQAEIASLDENLYRHDFSPAEKVAAIARRKALWDALHARGDTAGDMAKWCEGDLPRAPAPLPSGTTGSSTGSKPNAGGRGNKGFVHEVAARTGMSERTSHRVTKRAAVLGEDASRMVGTSLDEPGELDALAATDDATRADLIQRAEAGEKVSAKQHAPHKPKAPAATPKADEPKAAPVSERTPEDYIDDLIQALRACAAHLSVDAVAHYQITGRIGQAERQLIHSLAAEPAMADVQDGLFDPDATTDTAASQPSADSLPSAPTPPASDVRVSTDRFLQACGADGSEITAPMPAANPTEPRPPAVGVGRWHPTAGVPDLLGAPPSNQPGA